MTIFDFFKIPVQESITCEIEKKRKREFYFKMKGSDGQYLVRGFVNGHNMEEAKTKLSRANKGRLKFVVK